MKPWWHRTVVIVFALFFRECPRPLNCMSNSQIQPFCQNGRKSLLMVYFILGFFFNCLNFSGRMLWHAEENLEITEDKGKHCGISIQSEVALESDSTAEIPYVRIKTMAPSAHSRMAHNTREDLKLVTEVVTRRVRLFSVLPSRVQ